MALRLWPTCYSVFNVHALLQGGGGRLTGSVCFSPMWGADRVPFNNLPCDHFLKVAKSGDEGIRTPDLRRAKAALSQLSYIPENSGIRWAFQDSNLRPRPYQRRALTN